MIPVASEEQLLLVELVRSVSAMRTETVMQTVKEVLKQPPAIAKDKVSIPELHPIFSTYPPYERKQARRTFFNCLGGHSSVVTTSLELNVVSFESFFIFLSNNVSGARTIVLWYDQYVREVEFRK